MTESLARVALFAVILLFPFSQERLFIADIPVYFHEIAILFAVSAFITSKKKILFPPNIILFASALLLFGGVSSLLVNGLDNTGLGILKSWFIFPIMYGFLIFQYLGDFRFRDSLLFLWLLVSIAAAAAVIFLPFEEKWTFDGRLRAFFPSPNHLGLFFSPGILIGLFLVIGSIFQKRKISAAVLLIGVTLIMIAITLSHSATAIIGTAIAAALFISLIIFPYEFAKKIILAVIFILFVAFVSYFSSHWKEFSSGEVRSSLASRVMIWNASFDMIYEYPIFGIGPGNFQEMYLQNQQKFSPYLEWAVPHPHNVFLAFLLNVGALGLLGFIFVVVFSCQYAAVLLKGTGYGEARLFPALILAFFLLFLSQGMVDTPYFKNEFALFFWIFVAFALSIRINKKTA